MTNTLTAAHLSPPEIVETIRQHTAFIRITVPRGDMPKVFGPTAQELVATLTAQGVPPQGGAFAHHVKLPSEIFDFELGFVVAAPFAPTGRVQAGLWPAERAAHTIYSGGYEGLPKAWSAFMTWAKDEKLGMSDEIWEHYVMGPHSSADPKDWRTHLYRPLAS